VILRSLTLENFGLFAGRVVIDLSVRRKSGKPSIVLVGGKNGAGKTTVLEAVRLALYGKRALGPSVGQAEYGEYLRHRTHRPPKAEVAPRGGSVGLEFDYAESGVLRHYQIRRSWAARAKSVTEELIVEQDGSQLTDVRREEWQEFLNDLIPPGVSQLFFFDAEKIQELADSETDQEQLASAIRSLLGIELVSRLRDDLGLYLARQNRNGNGRDSERLEELETELAAVEGQAATLREQLADLRTRRDAETRESERCRLRFIREGGDLAGKRQQLESEKESITTQIAQLQSELADLANGLLPFAVAPRLARQFAACLLQGDATNVAARKDIVRALRGSLKDWRKAATPPRKARWAPKHWTDLQLFLTSWVKQTSGAESVAGLLGGASRQSVNSWLRDTHVFVRPRLRALGVELERLSSRREELAVLLTRAAGGDSAGLLEDLRQAEQRVGATDALIGAASAELGQCRAALERLTRERRELFEKQQNQTQQDRRAALAANAARALAAYERKVTLRKLDQLRQEFVSCFNLLSRKGDIVSAVTVDPVTFEVALANAEGVSVRKAALSAGEKQIYAIAMLWALARTSGRPLPMIIDTPLARLDSDHRSNLIERYFPTASHQVLVLSTDTEVDGEYFEMLSPHISHSYHLRYDGEAGRTAVEEGYFWKLNGRAARRHALQQV
jgi:DNA sulfur modification protein DndD